MSIHSPHHTANPNDSSKVGYAFPLDDNHPFPGVAAPASAAAAAAAGHNTRRGSGAGSNGNGAGAAPAANGGAGNKRAAAGSNSNSASNSNASSRRGSPASLGEGDAEPMRKKERRSSPHDPNAAEVRFVGVSLIDM